VGGGAFNLGSADFSDTNDTDNNFSYQFVFNFVGGALDRTDDSPYWMRISVHKHSSFNYSNLLSVSWGNDPGNDPFGLQWTM